MSTTIDERIVSLKFDAKGFQDGVKKTLGSVSDLKKNLTPDGLGLNQFKNAFDFKPIVNGFKDFTKSLDFRGVSRGVSDMVKSFNFKEAISSFEGFKKNFNFKPVIEGFKDLGRSIDFGKITAGFKEFGRNFSFKGAIDGLAELRSAASNVRLDEAAKGVDGLTAKFDKLSVVGTAALAAISAKAAIMGANFIQKSFLQQPLEGLQEYELQINATQTILANTQSKGSTIEDVNGALEDLNTYADKTIYNFAAMTDSIGKFTSAGVDLDTAVSSIKGLSNVAALGGADAHQARTAMQQMSQEMASGQIRLQGWTSMETAGMGGEALQEALKRTARNHGKNVDAMIKKNGSFRESLREGWLTAEVFSDTMEQFTGDMTDAELAQQGYNKQQIKDIQEIARLANESATKVKTFTQLMETVGEAIGSGWAKSWQLIIGDLEEAKELFTFLSDEIGKPIGASADARNAQLEIWRDEGGRAAAVEALKNTFKALQSILGPVNKAMKEVFPSRLGQNLTLISKALRDFTSGLILSETASTTVYKAFKLLFSIFKFGFVVIGGVLGVIFKIIKAFFNAGQTIASAGSGISSFFDLLQKALEDTSWVTRFFEVLGDGAVSVIHVLGELGSVVFAAVGAFVQFASGGLTKALDISRGLVSGLGDGVADLFNNLRNLDASSVVNWFKSLGNELEKVWTNFQELDGIKQIIDWVERLGERFKNLWELIKPIFDAIGNMLGDIGKNLGKVFDDVDYSATLDTVGVGLIGGIFLMLKKFLSKPDDLFKGLTDAVSGNLTKLTDGIVSVFEGLTGVLQAMQTSIKADAIMKIAIAIGIMVAALVVLSLIDSEKLIYSLGAIGALFVMLNKSLSVMEGLVASPGIVKMPLVAAALLLLAGAIIALSIAATIMARLEWGELIKGLAGVIVLLIAIAKAANMMSGSTGVMVRTGAAMILIAVALNILVSAVKKLGELDFGTLVKGLGATIVLLIAIAKTANMMSKNATGMFAAGAAMVLVAVALRILVGAVKDLADMDLGSMIQGIVGVTVLMAALTAFAKAASGSTGLVQAAVGIAIIAGAMILLAEALKRLGSMDFLTLATGLVAMGAALWIVTKAMLAMPPNLAISALGLVLVAGALVVLGMALSSMAGMSWDEIARGLVVLAGSLIMISLAMAAMTTALPGAAALLVVVAALNLLVPVLIALGLMSWEMIGKSLLMLAGVFVIFAAAGLLLAPLAPIFIALGAAMLMFGAGIALAGAGVLAMVTALTLLAGVAIIAGPALINLFKSLLELIPLALEMFAKGIVRFAAIIGESIPTFIAAAVALITAIAQAIAQTAPMVINLLVDLISQLLTVIQQRLPEFLDKGISIVISILDGIASRMGELIRAATDLVVEFIRGVEEMLPRVARAGVDLVLTFIDEVADGLIRSIDRIIDAANRVGKAVIQGLLRGLESMAGDAIGFVTNLGGNMLGAIKNTLGINSPAKEVIPFGEAFDEGLILGMRNMAGAVGRSAADVGDTALSELQRSMSNVGKKVNGDLDLSPTIRPVLDLSNVARGANGMRSMLEGPRLSLESTYASASAISTGRRDGDLMRSSVEAFGGGSRGDVTFQQNITSPRALSEIEIYRQTNNLLSSAKGALNK